MAYLSISDERAPVQSVERQYQFMVAGLPDAAVAGLCDFHGIAPTREALTHWGVSFIEGLTRKPRRRPSGKGALWLRYQALKLANGKCQLCGHGAAEGAVLKVDHIRPFATHPELAHDLDNLQVLCTDCNLGKAEFDDTDWR